MKNLCSLVILVACHNEHPTKPDAPPPMPTAVVVAGDFTAGHPGIMSTVDIDTQAVSKNVAPAGAVGDDPVLRKYGNELFVVNRADGNNVTILDATTYALVLQIGTGAGSNPWDVAIKGDKLYVPVWGGSGVAVLNRGSSNITPIDLSMDDPDGKPNCVSNYLVGDQLYVACELLDDMTFMPRGPGKVYVVDTNTDTLAHSITMTYANPTNMFHATPSGDLLIETANYMTGDGCIEKITTGATPADAGCVVTNGAMGGSVSRLEVVGTQMWLAIASPSFMPQWLASFDMTSNMLGAPISPTTELIGDLAPCPDGTIVVADQKKNASGLRLYNNGAELTTAALAVGLDTASADALVCY
jgi:hypothetical protein